MQFRIEINQLVAHHSILSNDSMNQLSEFTRNLFKRIIKLYSYQIYNSFEAIADSVEVQCVQVMSRYDEFPVNG